MFGPEKGPTYIIIIALCLLSDKSYVIILMHFNEGITQLSSYVSVSIIIVIACLMTKEYMQRFESIGPPHYN